MQSGIHEGNAMKYSLFTHWRIVWLGVTVFAARGLAEPADQVNQQEDNKEEKIQQKAREEYAGLWHIEKLHRKAIHQRQTNELSSTIRKMVHGPYL